MWNKESCMQLLFVLSLSEAPKLTSIVVKQIWAKFGLIRAGFID